MKWIIFVLIMSTSFCLALDAELILPSGLDQQLIIDHFPDEELFFINATSQVSNFTMTINSPIGLLASVDPVSFSVSTNNPGTCVYSLDGGNNNNSMSTGGVLHTAQQTLIFGDYFVTFFCNDGVDFLSAGSAFTVETPSGGGTGPRKNITLLSVDILNEDLCSEKERIIFVPKNFNGNFTPINSAELFFNGIKQNSTLFIDQYDKNYYFKIDFIKAQRNLNVTIVVNQNLKKVSDSKIYDVQTCRTLKEIIEDKAEVSDGFIKSYFIYILICFCFLCFLILLAIVIRKIRKEISNR